MQNLPHILLQYNRDGLISCSYISSQSNDSLTMYTGATPFMEQLEFMAFVMFRHTCTCNIFLIGLEKSVLVRRLPVVS